MAFEPGEKYRTAINQKTHAAVALRNNGGSAMNVIEVEYRSPESADFRFAIWLKNTSGEPNVIIDVGSLERMFRAQGQIDVVANTKLVSDIFQGLAVIDRKWHLMRETQFGSNYEEYARKGAKFSFVMPSDEELRQLTT